MGSFVFFLAEFKFIRQHNNINPVTKEPLSPTDLITLHYSRKASGEIHDPISFKPFSEHSHIVAIATTGNVFLAESVKGGMDLVADVKFARWGAFPFINVAPISLGLLITLSLRDDIITLQNPHSFPQMSVSKTMDKVESEKTKVVAKAVVTAQAAAKSKNIPCKLFAVIHVLMSVLIQHREHLTLLHRASRSVTHFDFG